MWDKNLTSTEVIVAQYKLGKGKLDSYGKLFKYMHQRLNNNGGWKKIGPLAEYYVLAMSGLEQKYKEEIANFFFDKAFSDYHVMEMHEYKYQISEESKSSKIFDKDFGSSIKIVNEYIMQKCWSDTQQIHLEKKLNKVLKEKEVDVKTLDELSEVISQLINPMYEKKSLEVLLNGFYIQMIDKLLKKPTKAEIDWLSKNAFLLRLTTEENYSNVFKLIKEAKDESLVSWTNIVVSIGNIDNKNILKRIKQDVDKVDVLPHLEACQESENGLTIIFDMDKMARTIYIQGVFPEFFTTTYPRGRYAVEEMKDFLMKDFFETLVEVFNEKLAKKVNVQNDKERQVHITIELLDSYSSQKLKALKNFLMTEIDKKLSEKTMISKMNVQDFTIKLDDLLMRQDVVYSEVKKPIKKF